MQQTSWLVSSWFRNTGYTPTAIIVNAGRQLTGFQLISVLPILYMPTALPSMQQNSWLVSSWFRIAGYMYMPITLPSMQQQLTGFSWSPYCRLHAHRITDNAARQLTSASNWPRYFWFYGMSTTFIIKTCFSSPVWCFITWKKEYVDWYPTPWIVSNNVNFLS